MAWTSPKTFVANEVLSADELNIHLRDNLLEMAASKATNPGSMFITEDVNSIMELPVASAVVDESGDTSSATYVNIDQIGPQVTVTTGSYAAVWLFAYTYQTAGNAAAMSYDVSGATTIAASDSRSFLIQNASGQRISASLFHDDLNPGVNTFTAKYRMAGAAPDRGVWAGRRLAVLPL